MVTLTGTFTRLDGSPATGTVRVTPSRSPIMDPDGKIVISGPQEFPLDQDGKLSVPVPASNDPDLGPPFTYWIDVNLSHANWKISKVWIPHGSSTVDLSDIADYEPTPGMETRVVTIPADGTDGQVLVWDGAGFSWDFPPKGDKGDQGDPGTSDIVVDTSVGTRVFANGVMIYGDTGWRNVESLLDPAVVPAAISGRAVVRRVNSQVFWLLRVRFVEPRSTGDTQSVLTSIPAEFNQVPTTYGTLGMGLSFPSRIVFSVENSSSPSSLVVRGPGSGEWSDSETLSASFSYSTTRSWPTTLPGIPG